MAYQSAEPTPMKPADQSIELPIQHGPQSVPMGGKEFMPEPDQGVPGGGFLVKTPATGEEVGDMTKAIGGVQTAESGVAFDYNTFDGQPGKYPDGGKEMVKLPEK